MKRYTKQPNRQHNISRIVVVKLKLILEKAKNEHITSISNLVNLAYRGKDGWTKETDLVSGDRTRTDDIQTYLSDPNAHLLIAIEAGEIVSCICVEKNDNRAYIGLFAVHPKLQGSGVGKDILAQAERYAAINLNIDRYVMIVVSQRAELIAYYERRGYSRTGDIQDYPAHLNVGMPLAAGLTIETLEKRVNIT